MVLYICDFGLKIDRYCRKENQVLCVMQKMLTLQIEHARNNFSKFTEFNKLVGGQVTWSPVIGGLENVFVELYARVMYPADRLLL